MAKKNTYQAIIKYNEGMDVLDVDMLNLPYDMFGPNFPLEISGPVDMGKCKGQDLPDMSNVIIRGAFDCSTCAINADTVFPDGITELICKHSINSLDVLIGKLPNSVHTVVIRPALFTAIKECFKKSAQDDVAYQNAIKFIEFYPNITVSDGKKTLTDIIQECTDKSKPVNKPVPQPTPVVTPMPEQQTDDWLSVNDLVPVCQVALGPDILARLDKDLKRYIRQALNVKSGIKIETREMRRADGTRVKCIRREDVNLVAEQIAQSVLSQEKTESKDTKTTKVSRKTNVAPKVSAEPRKYYVDNREIEPIKIKKYISKAAWGQILSKVGKNMNALLDILQDIENINVNPALAHTASGQVVFIKDGAVQVSPTVGFKNGRCLAQGFGTLDDRPRIVWGICGNTFVCQNFYPAHEGKVKLEYNTLLRTIDIDLTAIDLKEYLLVSDLIKEIKASRPAPKEEIKPDEPKLDALVKTVPVDTPSEPKSVVAPESQVETKPKRPRIVKATTAPEVTEPVKIIPDTTSASDAEPVPRPEKTYKWASLYHLNGRLIAKYRATVAQQQELLNALSTQTDTELLLQATQKLQRVLETKKKIEAARKEIEQKNKELFDFIQKINVDLR